MKNIFQLAKLGRRIPRLTARFAKRLDKAGLTGMERLGYRRRIVGLGTAQRRLVLEMKRRRIGAPPLRSCVPHKLRTISQAEQDRADFVQAYGDGNCSCHIAPPCGSCTHPGNPANQEAVAA